LGAMREGTELPLLVKVPLGAAPELAEAAAKAAADALVVGAPPYASDPDAAARIAGATPFRDWPLVVVTDEPGRAAASAMNFLWTTFTRFEPAADIHAADRRIVRNHIAYRAPIVIDARLKPGFPKELTCRPDVAAKVTNRWKEYFPSGRVEMGDSEKGHLD